jgi:hypothetical protein
MTLSRSSLRRARSAHRTSTAAGLKEAFNPQVPLTVHWDGKLLPDLTGREKVDRLPVIVTGRHIENLLAIPKLASGTDRAQADAVLACLDKWNLRHKVAGLCFDTTASNTGHHSGACVLIEQGLGETFFILHAVIM